MAYDKAQLQKQLSALETRFSLFQSKRQEWDRLVRREIKIDLPPEITGDLDPIDYQSADTEKAIFDHVDVLMMNPTRFDINMNDYHDTAQKNARDILLWTARAWAELDRDRWWDACVAEGQVRHGVKVMQLNWKRSVKGEKSNLPFYWSDTNIFGCYWTENKREIDLFIYKYMQPVVGCGIEKDGKRLTLDSMGEIGWLGNEEAHDQESVYGKNIEVIICDYRDLDGKMCPLEGCNHPLRYISVYVNKDGGKLENAEDVDTYPSPFPGCSFFVIPGRQSFHETDPHERYRPMMLPMYQEMYNQLYLKTTLATAARKDMGESRIYANVAKMPPHLTLPEGGTKWEFTMPQIGSNSIPAFPELERVPTVISPHLMEMIHDSEKKMGEYMPNRFVIGTAFTEASNATGTAFLQQAQQAALPYNRHLTQTDGAIKKGFEYMFHAIRYHAIADPDKSKTEYGQTVTANENVMRYTNTLKKGEQVSIDADKLSVDFDLILKTESMTLAEEGARWLQAVNKYHEGVYSPRMLAKDAGIFDLESWEEEMFALEIREDMAPFELALIERKLQRSASNRTGRAEFAEIGQLLTQGQNGQNGGGQPPATPYQNGGPPPESRTVAPNALMGRSMQQAAINGPGGGSSPMQ